MLQNLKTLVVIEGLLLIGLALYRFALATRHRGVVSPRAVGLTLLTPAVGLLSGNAFVFYAYLAGAVAFNARSRAELSANYLLMLPMTPLLALQTAAGDVYLFPLSAVVAMNLGALIAVLVSSGRRSFARPELDAAALLLVALFVYVDARGVSATSVVRSVITFFVAFGGPYFLISRGLTRREDIDLALLRLGLAGVMVAIVAAFETIRHWVLYQTFNEALHVPIPLQSATLMMRGGRLRTGGPMVDYTAAGVLLATVLVLLPYLKPRFRAPWFWAVAVAVAAGLFATQSRGAWIAAAAGLVAILVYRGRYWRAVMLAAAGAGRAGGGVPLPQRLVAAGGDARQERRVRLHHRLSQEPALARAGAGRGAPAVRAAAQAAGGEPARSYAGAAYRRFRQLAPLRRDGGGNPVVSGLGRHLVAAGSPQLARANGCGGRGDPRRSAVRDRGDDHGRDLGDLDHRPQSHLADDRAGAGGAMRGAGAVGRARQRPAAGRTLVAGMPREREPAPLAPA